MTFSRELHDAATRLVDQNVNQNVSYLVSTLAQNSLDLTDSTSKDLYNLCEQALELARPIPDYESAAIEHGAIQTHEGEWKHPGDDDTMGGADEYCEAFGIEPYDREVYEHWAISSWFAEKLIEAGEKVDTDFAGMCVWARTTTGQAISMDGVLTDIVKALGWVQETTGEPA